MKIPIQLYLELRQRIEDTLLHDLEFSVVGNEASKTVVVIQSDFFRNPKITQFEQNGLAMLDADLRDLFFAKLFRMAVAEMRAADGDAIVWTISDLTRWINKQFSVPDAATLEHVLNSFERREQIVQNRAEVRVD